MNRKPSDMNLDQWLDQALADYVRCEPPPDLETLTVANLRNRPARRTWWLSWHRAALVSAAALAAVLFMVVLLGRREMPVAPDLPGRNDQELLLGVDRMLNKEVPSALEPALVLTKEIVRKK